MLRGLDPVNHNTSPPHARMETHFGRYNTCPQIGGALAIRTYMSLVACFTGWTQWMRKGQTAGVPVIEF